MRGILDAALQNLEAINLRGKLRGDCRLGKIAFFEIVRAAPAVSASTTASGPAHESRCGIGQRMGMAVHVFTVSSVAPGKAMS